MRHKTPRYLRIVAFMVVGLTLALFVDQVAYLRWHRQAQATIAELRASIQDPEKHKFGRVRIAANAYFVRRDSQFLLFHSPPALAWTYWLERTSVGLAIMRPWHFLLWRTVGGLAQSHPMLQEAIQQHTGYVIGIATCSNTLSCPPESASKWVVWVEHGPTF